VGSQAFIDPLCHKEPAREGTMMAHKSGEMDTPWAIGSSNVELHSFQSNLYISTSVCYEWFKYNYVFPKCQFLLSYHKSYSSSPLAIF
jgi:hypothetical protein